MFTNQPCNRLQETPVIGLPTQISRARWQEQPEAFHLTRPVIFRIELYSKLAVAHCDTGLHDVDIGHVAIPIQVCRNHNLHGVTRWNTLATREFPLIIKYRNINLKNSWPQASWIQQNFEFLPAVLRIINKRIIRLSYTLEVAIRNALRFCVVVCSAHAQPKSCRITSCRLPTAD